jgi:6-phosphofructokinase
MSEGPVLAIIIGGGPAPGLNGVISSATMYAIQLGYRVIAFHDGYKHLATGNKEEIEANVMELNVDDIVHISSDGGSIIRPSRYDPSKYPDKVHTVLSMLREYKVRYLLIIGGNQKIKTTHIVTQGIDPKDMQIIVIPKTIDNDIQLPYGQTTFGFHSARRFCTELVTNLNKDARSAPRWFIIETMGKTTGHLALSVSDASGAHLCIIPEDFGCKNITLDKICDVLEGAILKRYLAGKPYGICVMSQGLIKYLPEEEKKSLFEEGIIPMNEGHINLDEAEISRAIRNRMRERFAKIELKIGMTPVKIGYELRCMKPVAFDAIYSRELGFGAIEGFRQRHSNCIVVWENGLISFKSFRSLMNPEDGKIHPRHVDTTSQNYKISREYGWQMKKLDLDDPEKVKKLAAIAKCSVEEFHQKFDGIADKCPTV